MPIESNLLKGYQTALELAATSFCNADPAALAQRSGAAHDPASHLTRLTYLTKDYLIAWPSGSVSRDQSADDVPMTTTVLLLNYLISARSIPLTGELIAFRDLPGAATYEPSFNKRSVVPLAKTFDGKPELLHSAGEAMGGVKSDIADASVRLKVLPHLEITYAVWNSDEEFSARGMILFDSSTKRLMTAECMIVAASNGVYALMGVAKSLAGK